MIRATNGHRGSFGMKLDITDIAGDGMSSKALRPNRKVWGFPGVAWRSATGRGVSTTLALAMVFAGSARAAFAELEEPPAADIVAEAPAPSDPDPCPWVKDIFVDDPDCVEPPPKVVVIGPSATASETTSSKSSGSTESSSAAVEAKPTATASETTSSKSSGSTESTSAAVEAKPTATASETTSTEASDAAKQTAEATEPVETTSPESSDSTDSDEATATPEEQGPTKAPRATVYAVNQYVDGGNGTLEVSPSAVSEGATVRVTATPSRGFEFVSLTTDPAGLVTDLNVDSNGVARGSFTMPGQNVRVGVVFRNIPGFQFSVNTAANPAEGGKVSGPATAAAGTWVYMTATPNPGWKLTGWTRTGPGESAWIQADGSFLMPGNTDVLVTANFEKLPEFTVTTAANPPEGGTLTANKAMTYAGDTVTLTATPTRGWQRVSWTTDPADLRMGTYLDIFTMRDQAVSVTANFQKIPDSWFGVTVINGTGTGEYFVGDPVAISADTPPVGTVFDKWIVTPAEDSALWLDLDPSIPDTTFTMPNKSVTLEATYRDKVATVNYSATAGGSVTPTSESFDTETESPTGSTATAAAGYVFDGWYRGDNKVSSEPTFKPTNPESGATYVAKFVEKDAVTLSYSASAGGSVTPASESVKPATGVAQGSTASALPGYVFDGWYLGDVKVSDNAKLTLDKPADGWAAASYVAKFVEKAAVTLTYSATTGGSVAPASESVKPATGVATGSTASAAPGYEFDGWYLGDAKVSDNAKLTLDKPADGWAAASYVAKFVEKAAVTLTYSATAGGSVTRTSETTKPATGSPLGSEAGTPVKGYQFDGWYSASDSAFASRLSQALPFVPSKNSDNIYVAASYVARYVRDTSVAFDVTTAVTGSGALSAPATAAEGETVALTVTPTKGWELKGWTTVPAGLSIGADGTFTMPDSDVEVTANFERDYDYAFDVTATANPTTGGTVVADKSTAVEGATVKLTATPTKGWKLSSWTTTPTSLSIGDDGTFTMPDQDVSVTANFEKIAGFEFDVTATASPSNGGTVSAPATAVEGDTVALAVTPTKGWELKDWTTVPDGLSIGADGTFTMPDSDVEVTANFERDYNYAFDVTAAANPTTGGTVSVDKSTAAEGATVTLTATATKGWELKGWTTTPDNLVIGANGTFTMPDQDVSVTANFERNYDHAFAVTTAVNGSGTHSAPETAIEGDTVKLTATPDKGWKFVGWTTVPDDVVISEDGTFVMHDHDVSVTANFEKIAGFEFDVTTAANPSTGGTVSAPATAAEGVTVQLTATPTKGWKLGSWTTVPAGLVIDEDGSFTMPDQDVSVTANFERIRDFAWDIDLTVTPNASYGSVEAKVGDVVVTKAAAGTQVTLTASPTSTAAFRSWHSELAEIDGKTDASITFVMPDNDVAVEAEFGLKPTPPARCEWDATLLATDEACVEPAKCQWDASLLATDKHCVKPVEPAKCQWDASLLATDEHCVKPVEPAKCQWDASLLATDEHCVKPVEPAKCQWDASLLATDKHCVKPVEPAKCQWDASLLATDKHCVKPVEPAKCHWDASLLATDKACVKPVEPAKCQWDASLLATDKHCVKPVEPTTSKPTSPTTSPLHTTGTKTSSVPYSSAATTAASPAVTPSSDTSTTHKHAVTGVQLASLVGAVLAIGTGMGWLRSSKRRTA